jgi:hypothetical protein
MARYPPTIAWKPQPLRARLSRFVARIYSPAPPELRAIRRALTSVPIPETVGATTPKEDALGLLKMAAEVEHALMVRYLYASLSLNGVAAAAVTRVAVQEMGHLVSVQNLLLAIGGLNTAGLPADYHLGRDLIRRSSDLNPLPLVLDAVSHSSLAEFVTVERPAFIADVQLRQKVDALGREAQQAAGTTPHPVGALYAKLYWLFQPSDDPTGPLQLSPAQGFRRGWHLQPTDFLEAAAIDRFAAIAAEWGGTPGLIVGVAHNQAEACDVLQHIIAQGEGALPAGDSHFERFLGLVQQFQSADGLGPVSPLPRSPYVDGQQNPEDPQSTPITNAYTVLWARLFNIRYALLLLDIGWALSLPDTDARRSAMTALAPDEMSQVIRALFLYLRASPLAAGGNTAIAGPPFALLSEQLPDTPTDYKSTYNALIAQSTQATAAIKARAEYQTCQGGVCNVVDVDGELVLDQIDSIDRTRLPLLPP